MEEFQDNEKVKIYNVKCKRKEKISTTIILARVII